MIYDIIKNLEKILKTEILTAYTFFRTSEREYVDINIAPFADVPITDKSFTIVTGALDSSVDKNFLIGKYLKFNDEFKYITDYDTLTNIITYSSNFAIPITTLDTVTIMMLDNISISCLDDYDLPSRLYAFRQKAIFEIAIKCIGRDGFPKDDAKARIDTLCDYVKTAFYTKYRMNLPIYNLTFTSKLSTLKLDSNMQRIDMTDDKVSTKDLTHYLLRFSGTFLKK